VPEKSHATEELAGAVVMAVSASAVDSNNSDVPIATTRSIVTTHISVTITSTTATIVTSVCETSSDWSPVPVFVPRWLGAARNRIHTVLAEERCRTGRNNV
jgi:hypothetical protein